MTYNLKMPLQELFEKIDLEEDGLVYLKEIVVNVLLSRTSIFPDFLLDIDFKIIKKLYLSHCQVYLRAMNEEMDNACEKNLKASCK